jgi:arsenate reductase
VSAAKPIVLFVCIQNAGRSQMAQALFERVAGGRAEARSGGSKPAARVHPEVAEVMREIGIELSDRTPKALGPELTDDATLVVTMGCGDECPYIPGARVIDWDLDDPSGKPLDEVRGIRDKINTNVRSLVDELTGT